MHAGDVHALLDIRMRLSRRCALLGAHCLVPRCMLLCVRPLGALLGALSQAWASDILVSIDYSIFLVRLLSFR